MYLFNTKVALSRIQGNERSSQIHCIISKNQMHTPCISVPSLKFCKNFINLTNVTLTWLSALIVQCPLWFRQINKKQQKRLPLLIMLYWTNTFTLKDKNLQLWNKMGGNTHKSMPSMKYLTEFFAHKPDIQNVVELFFIPR